MEKHKVRGAIPRTIGAAEQLHAIRLPGKRGGNHRHLCAEPAEDLRTPQPDRSKHKICSE